MRLTKHHGLGNDFLVLLDLDGSQTITPAQAVALCDRHTGVGADGLIRVSEGVDGGDVTMTLLNADGSRAEMSGNGIRAMAQAVFQHGIVSPPVLQVATDAGRRRVTLLERRSASTHRMSVEMGPAKVVPGEEEWVTGPVVQAARVDLGNPHVVLRWDAPSLPELDELVAIGARIDGATPGGANVEIISTNGPGRVEMVVYERGVGPTRACGTGACAAAAAAHEWGLAGTETTIEMPGGPVDVVLGDPVLLIGDVTSTAVVHTPWP